MHNMQLKYLCVHTYFYTQRRMEKLHNIAALQRILRYSQQEYEKKLNLDKKNPSE